MDFSFDTQSYSPELARHGLQVVTIATTPAEGGGRIIIDPKLDPATNPDLKQALAIYSKHYLASEEGIPGEGETLDVVLSRLRGEDDNVRRVSVLGLKDETGKIVGVSFTETYEVEKAPEYVVDGKDTGLVHLTTYAATEGKYNTTEINTAFHAALLNQVVANDNELGHPGDSLHVGEVNSAIGFDGKRQSNKMDGEFEIKTGAPREMREAYIHGGGDHIVALGGKHSAAHALGVRFTPPNLGGEEDIVIPEGITTTSDLAPFLRNSHAADGEMLFLSAESPYHMGITAADAALHKAFQQSFNVSVAQGNHGIEDKALIKEALRERSNNPEYAAMMDDYDSIIAAAAAKEKGKPSGTIITEGASMQDIDRGQQRRTGK